MRFALLALFVTQAFGQMTLQQALDLADQAAPEVQSARLAVLEAQVSALSVEAARKPQVNLNISTAAQTSNLQGIGLIASGIPSRIGPYRTFDARPVVSWRVYDLTLLASVKAAQARIKQNEADASAVKERTRAAVIDLYLQALEAESQARASEARIRTAEAVLEQTNLAEQAGRSSKLDVARATQQLEKERSVLVDLRQQRDVLSTMLQKTLGQEARAPITLSDIPEKPFAWDVEREPIVKEALDARPERRSSAARSQVIASEMEQADKQRYPKVDLIANYGLSGEGPDHSLGTWLVGASVTVPLWTAGRIENDIKAARYRQDAWKQDDRQLALGIEQEITQALVQGRAVTEQSTHLRAAAIAAKEALELARLRYEAGMATNLDVVTAQGELAQSEEELIRARYNGLVAEAHLARARGNVRLFADGR